MLHIATMLTGARLLLASTTAHAQVDRAYESANCSAAFLSTCLNVDSTTTTSSASPAPLPMIGATIWEAGVLAASLLAVWFARKRRRQDASQQR